MKIEVIVKAPKGESFNGHETGIVEHVKTKIQKDYLVEVSFWYMGTDLKTEDGYSIYLTIDTLENKNSIIPKYNTTQEEILRDVFGVSELKIKYKI